MMLEGPKLVKSAYEVASTIHIAYIIYVALANSMNNLSTVLFNICTDEDYTYKDLRWHFAKTIR